MTLLLNKNCFKTTICCIFLAACGVPDPDDNTMGDTQRCPEKQDLSSCSGSTVDNLTTADVVGSWNVPFNPTMVILEDGRNWIYLYSLKEDGTYFRSETEVQKIDPLCRGYSVGGLHYSEEGSYKIDGSTIVLTSNDAKVTRLDVNQIIEPNEQGVMQKRNHDGFRTR